MLDVDGLVVRAERGVLSAPERLLKFFGESVGVHVDPRFLLIKLTILS